MDDDDDEGDDDDDEGDDDDDEEDRTRADDACNKRRCRGDRPPNVRRGGSTSSAAIPYRHDVRCYRLILGHILGTRLGQGAETT